ncbi:MAG TPA: NAD(P)H-hydrate dehydratase [Xanthomonadales bacterium]|nr:NAD(P)H-hydrate dehydratase [Xanthomonadales bacterium]
MSAAGKLTRRALRAHPLPDPCRSESKEDRGQVLVVGGSREVPGAVLLAAIAALRAGAGKLQVATASAAALPLAIELPEAMVMGLPMDRAGRIRAASANVLAQAALADALLVGPGMAPTPATQRVAKALLARAPRGVVLDAGALQLPVIEAIAARRRARPAILTPHLGEMASLLDRDLAAIENAARDIAREHAQRWGVVLVLKGATTHIGTPDGAVWTHTGGSVGLGTSGSGDVLAGIIAGLAARGADAVGAALWGVYLHAEAGARLSRRSGPVGFLAREIGAEVPALL